MHLLINILALQAGWFACVLGASFGHPYLGPAVAAGLIVLHLSLSDDRRREALLIAAAAVMGTGLDALLLNTGAISFADAMWIGWAAPLWMTALWMNFATSLNVALGWLKGRYLLAGVVGAGGGALAYTAGARLGAISLEAAWAPAGIAAAWALALPALILINHSIRTAGWSSPWLREVEAS